jgi:hypothetical protein
MLLFMCSDIGTRSSDSSIGSEIVSTSPNPAPAGGRATRAAETRQRKRRTQA